MASIGHIIVGMSAAKLHLQKERVSWSRVTVMTIWSGLSLLPDADVWGFAMGVAYEDPFGHRGATHSFAFAVAIAIVAGFVAKAAKQRPLRTALIVLVVVASHPLLDTLTDGGLGCALFWPLSYERFFAPFRPIPVAPIGRGLFSLRGLTVASFELVMFAPLLIYALLPPKKPDPFAETPDAPSE